MSEFHSTLDVRMLPEMDDQNWMLIAPLVYQSDVMKCNIVVPVGFITNYVSFAPLKDKGQRAAVLHDYLYSCSDINKSLADKVLREALESVGISQMLANAMYFAVLSFGSTFKKTAENEYPFKFYS